MLSPYEFRKPYKLRDVFQVTLKNIIKKRWVYDSCKCFVLSVQGSTWLQNRSKGDHRAEKVIVAEYLDDLKLRVLMAQTFTYLSDMKC